VDDCHASCGGALVASGAKHNKVTRNNNEIRHERAAKSAGNVPGKVKGIGIADTPNTHASHWLRSSMNHFSSANTRMAFSNAACNSTTNTTQKHTKRMQKIEFAKENKTQKKSEKLHRE
jgi:hypothetical protein